MYEKLFIRVRRDKNLPLSIHQEYLYGIQVTEDTFGK